MIVEDVLPGAIAPRPPNLEYPARQYGAPLEAATIEVIEHGSSTVRHSQSWESALHGSGLPTATDGRNYTLIVMGPSLNLPAGSWHNSVNITVVDSDP